MNTFDRILAGISPQRAVKRQMARKQLEILNTGYSNSGASKSKKSMIGWTFKGGSSKEDIDDNLSVLRERSRDLYMNTPIATGALKTIRTNVIGAGLRLNAQIDFEYLGMTEEEADVWETNVEREFSLWSETILCDSMQMNNFYELQQIAFLSFLMSGESFVTLPYIERKGTPYGLKVQLIEADRIMSPTGINHKIISGVEVGNYGEVVAYHVAQFHPLSNGVSEKKWLRIEKFGKESGRQNILHLMEAERPEQRRGTPLLSPVIESIKQLGRYSDAELMAALISSMYTVFIKSENPGDSPLGEVIPDNQRVDDADENSYELGSGAIIGLAENESIEVANPGRNNSSFDAFVTAICRQIGSAIEVPYELLLKHFTSSYSASRAALLESWKMFRSRRAWVAARFCQPIYEEFLNEAISSGRINAPGFFDDPIIRKAYAGAEWNGPSQGQIDPLKEVNAAAKRVEEGFSTRSRETTELTGGDYWKNTRQRVREEQSRREGGLILNEKQTVLEVQKSSDELDDE
ncbi:MAG: phage portal protein [Paenisporosarcina sp.]